MFTSEQLNFKNHPYNLNSLFTQVCQYKCFETNLKRALLLNNPSFIKKVRLINSKWFDKWKKISCYEAIKDELDMGSSIQINFNKNKNNYINIINNLEIQDILDSNIKNNLLFSGFDTFSRKFIIKPDYQFELISPDLWDRFVPINGNNVNNEPSIEFDVEYLTKMALMIKLSKNTIYIMFWNLNEQQVEKIILEFPDEGQQFLVLDNLKALGINNFYACYLEDLVDIKNININNFSFKCINKTRNKKIIEIKNTENNINRENINFINDFNNNNNINSLLPVGLINIGQTCYMNSVLQCLVHIPKLSKYFLQNKNKIDDKNQILSYAYLQVVQNLLRKTNESQFITYYSPIEFQGIISINPLFNGAGDSIDLINYFFQTIHKELNFNTEEDILSRYLVNNNIGNNKKFQNLNFTINNFISSNKSIITNTFYIIEKSKIHCNTCNQMQYSFQFLSFIIFPLEDIRIYNFNKTGINQNSVTLMDGFEYYKRQYPMIGDNQMHCNICGMDTNGFQCSSFYSLPEIIVINLNRGHGNIYNVGIKFQENIDLSNYAEMYYEKNNNFKLIGIITHFGPSGISGHYIAFCFEKDKNAWYKFNDSMVTESNFQEASTTGDIYVLFYESQKN